MAARTCLFGFGVSFVWMNMVRATPGSDSDGRTPRMFWPMADCRSVEGPATNRWPHNPSGREAAKGDVAMQRLPCKTTVCSTSLVVVARPIIRGRDSTPAARRTATKAIVARARCPLRKGWGLATGIGDGRTPIHDTAADAQLLQQACVPATSAGV